MNQVALDLGYKGASGYQRYESPERREYLAPDFAQRLAAILAGKGVPPIARDEVLELAGNIRVIDDKFPSDAPQFTNLALAGQNISPYGQRDLPIYGQARGGDNRYYFENGAVALSHTFRPVELLNVRDAYGVYIHGNSMSPRFKHGELIYVDPHRPVSPGDDVVLQLHDGQGYIKELVRRTDRAVICRQHNPPAEIEYAATDVRSIHLIISATRVRV